MVIVSHILFIEKINFSSPISVLFFLQLKKINQRFPFDTKNPFGFLVAISMRYILDLSIMITVKCLAIFVLIYSMLFPSLKDIKKCLKTINKNAGRKNTSSKIINQLNFFVEFHSKLIQLSPSSLHFSAINDMEQWRKFTSFSD